MHANIVEGKLIKFDDSIKIYLIVFSDRMNHSTVYAELVGSDLVKEKIILDANDPYSKSYKVL